MNRYYLLFALFPILIAILSPDCKGKKEEAKGDALERGPAKMAGREVDTPSLVRADEGIDDRYVKIVEERRKKKIKIEKLKSPIVDPNKKYFANIETSKGKFTIELFAKEAPYTVSNFIHLSRAGFYDGVTFHRVIPGFVAQGGDPEGTGMGGPGYKFDDEFSDKTHVRGAVSMANAGPNTNGSQFFICFQPQPHLNQRHTVFGQVSEGMEVVDSLQKGDVILKIEIVER